MPRLNETIGNFKANSTLGEIDFYDYVGDSWCVLLSHPLDFTPVCTTELGRIALNFNEFKKRNVKIIGISCDDINSHHEWVKDIKSFCFENFDDVFPYPIIADPNRQLAVELDLLDEEGKNNLESAITIRNLYVVDPLKKLRLMMIYPVSTGRSIDELIRVIDSLQLVDEYKIIGTPANWLPGAKVMIHPSATEEQVKEVFPEYGVQTFKPQYGNYSIRTTAYCNLKN